MRIELFDLIRIQFWQISALTIIIAIVIRLAASNRPHLAHTLWLLVLIKCVTPPLWGHSLGVFSWFHAVSSWTESAISDENVPILLPADSGGRNKTTSNRDQQFTGVPSGQTDLLAVPAIEVAASGSMAAASVNSTTDEKFVLFTFFVGADVTFLIMIARCWRCLRLIYRNRTTEYDAFLCERIRFLTSQLRIRRAPNVVVSDVLFGPAVFGLWRNTIVLPKCLFITERNCDAVAVRDEFGPEATSVNCFVQPVIDVPTAVIDPILAHELLHISRHDLWAGLLQAIVQILWWFHPAVWFVNRWLSRAAEQSCDEQVIAELRCTPTQYARSLLSVIECKHRLRPVPVFPGMRPVEITSQRMERIMLLKNCKYRRTPVWCWLITLILALVVLPGAAVPSSQPQEGLPSSAPTPTPQLKSNNDLPKTQQAAAALPLNDFVTVCYPIPDLLGQKAMDPLLPFSTETLSHFSPDAILDDRGESRQVDFAPITELIKATVEPDSWGAKGAQIAVVMDRSFLVIRQTSAAHTQIHELLLQLRNIQYPGIQISCLLLKLPEESQAKSIENRCTLHPLRHGTRWALLPKHHFNELILSLSEMHAVTISRPQITTSPGQTANVEIGRQDEVGTSVTGVRMQMTPYLLPDGQVIRLQHSFSIGEFTKEMPQPVESLVGSGQTLLLLISDVDPAHDDDQKNGEYGAQYLLLMTLESFKDKQ